MHFLRSRICKLAIISCALLGFSTASYAQDITSNLVGYWKLDETSGNTIFDSSVNANSGTWSDGVNNNTSEETTTGAIKNAINFDGNDDEIEIPHSTVLNPNQLTYAAWFYIDALGSAHPHIIDKQGSGSGYGLFLNGTAGDLYGYIYTDGSINWIGSTRLNINEWYHGAVTYDGTTAKLYLNGSEITSVAVSGTFSPSSNPLTIGRRYNDIYPWNGSIDEVRVYSRALSATDISTLYSYSGATCLNPEGVTGQLIYNSDHNTPQYCNGTKWISAGKKAPPLSGLVGHWKLDETSGTTVANSAGNADGTLYNGLNASTNSVNGKQGNALQFDGSDDYMGTAYTPGAVGTISTWFKPDVTMNSSTADSAILSANGSGARNTIFRKDWAKGGAGTGECGGDNGSIDFVITPSNGNYSTVCTTTTTWNADEWYLLTASWDGTTQKIYVNGNLENTVPQTQTGGWGGLRVSPSGTFDGTVDEIRAYERVLTDSEIQSIYNTQQSSCKTPSEGIVSHWKLDETSGSFIFDSSGNGNSGTWVDGVNNDVAEETITGQETTALTFDGNNDQITVPHSASLDVSSGYTVSGWVYFDSAATGTIRPSMIGKNDTGGWGSGWVIGRSSAGGNIVGGKVRVAVQHNRNISGENASYSNWIYPVDTWNYVTITWNGSNTINYYLNGTFLMSGEVSTPPDTGSGDLTIGFARSNWGANYHDGHMDDIRIFNRALSDVEISSLYGSLTSGICSVSTCSNPFGSESALIYNTSSHVMQYCNGYEWMAMGVDGAGGGGCSSPSGTAGSLTYNTTSNVMQYCDGSAWHSIGQTGSNIDSTNGLVTHYKLDETTGTTVTDSSGNSYHGTMEGDLDADTDSVAGVDGTALRFAGTNITKIVGDTQDNMTELTTCLWFNLDSLSNADSDPYIELINKGSWRFIIEDVATTPRLRFSIATNNGYPIVRGSTTLSIGQWYHACAIYNGVGTTPRVYLNGVNDSSGGSGGTGTQQDDSARVVRIGAASLNEYYANFPGIMDDIRIYNRELNQSEITAVYNIAQNPCADSPNPGDQCLDGSYYAGLTPDGTVPMYVTSSVFEANETYNDGNTNYSNDDGCYGGAGPFARGVCRTSLLLTTDSDDITAGTQTHDAAVYCDNLTAHGYSNWYLPARDELLLLWNSGAPITDVQTDGTVYHSSTRRNNSQTWSVRFDTGGTSSTKDETLAVRCARQ